MTHVFEAEERRRGGTIRILRASVAERLLSLVSAGIENPAERALHARALGVLIGTGLVAAMLMPLAAVAEFGVWASTAPTILAGGLLAAAGLLAATGRFDLVLGGLSVALAGGLAVAAFHDGGLRSPALMLLAVAPVEAFVAGRRRLCATGLAAAATAAAALAAAEFSGRLPEPANFGSTAFASAMMLGYMALMAVRFSGKRKPERGAADHAAIEAKAVEDAMETALLRFEPSGRLVGLSERARALFGLTGDSFPEIADLLHVTDRIAFLKALDDIRAGAASIRIEARIRAASGEEDGFTPVELSLRPARTAEGELVSIIIVGKDISAERERNAVLKDALAEVTRSSAAKSQFLAAISHELRTPLNAIIGFSDILDQEIFGGFETPRQKEYIGLIRQSGEHLLSVVNGLLDVSKIEAGRYELVPEPFRMADVMTAAADIMRAEADRKGLRLEVRPGCSGAEIAADRRACHQMLLNLLSNALKFTEKGVVTVESRVVVGAMTFSVSDTGIGIAAAEISKLGQPFTQLSSGLARRYQGTGLGLSLVKGLAELHHGSMAIASEPGIGTMVTVRIPLDCAARIEASRNLKENIVDLSDARTKKHSDSPNFQKRRSA